MAREKIRTEDKKKEVLKKIGEAENANDLRKLRKEAAGQKVGLEFNAKIDDLKLTIRKIGAEGEKKARKNAGEQGVKGVKKIEEAAIKETEKTEAQIKQEVAAVEAGSSSPEKKKGFEAKHAQANYAPAHKKNLDAARKQSASSSSGAGPTEPVVIVDPKDVEEFHANEFRNDQPIEIELSTVVTAPGTSANLNNVPGANDATGKKTEDVQEDNETLKPLNLEDNGGEPTDPENPDAEPKNLEEARARFFEAYKQVEGARSWGYKAERFFTGEDKSYGGYIPGLGKDHFTNKDFVQVLFGKGRKSRTESPEIAKLREEYLSTQASYRSYLSQEATKMLQEGKSQVEVEEMIYNELKPKKEVLDPIIPEKVKDIFGKATSWYTNMDKKKRMVLSTAVAMTIVGTTGHIAGALGLATYGATRIARLAAGGALGQALVSAKNKWVGSAEKDIQKIGEKAREIAQDRIQNLQEEYGGMYPSDIKNLEYVMEKRLEKEHSARVKHLAIDFGIRMFAMGGTTAATHLAESYGVLGMGGAHESVSADEHAVKAPETESGGWWQSIKDKFTGKPAPTESTVPPTETETGAGNDAADNSNTETTTDPTNTETTPPAGDTPPTSTYEFKDIEDVKYSNEGAIATWVNVKANLREAYAEELKSGDLSRIPPGYQHILTSRADDLAKEFGGYNEAGESLNMLTGSSISFDDQGNVISHSAFNADGETEDHYLVKTDGAGAPTYAAEENERYMNFKAPATETPADAEDASQFGDPNQPPAQFQSGIDTHSGDSQFGDPDKNGFTGKSTLNLNKFESHTDDGDPTPETEDPNDPRDHWDGKRHSKLWYKNHAGDDEGTGSHLDKNHDRLAEKLYKAEMKDMERLHKIEQNVANENAGTYQTGGQPGYSGNVDDRIMRSGAQYGQDPRIMQSGNASPYGYHGGGEYYSYENLFGPHHEDFFEHYPKLAPEQVKAIMENPVREINKEYLLKAAQTDDRALPLFKVVHDLQARDFAMVKGETMGEFVQRAHDESPRFFLNMDRNLRTWLRMNGFFGQAE